MNIFRLSPIAALLAAAPAYAAADGTLGQTSTGTFNVTAVLSAPQIDNVLVSGLEDVNFAGSTADSFLPDQTMRFCIIRQNNGGDVGITVTSENLADAGFALKDGTTHAIGLTFTLATPGNVTHSLSYGSETVAAVQSACTKGDLATDSALLISVPPPAIGAPPRVAGTYGNFFIITVAPK